MNTISTNFTTIYHQHREFLQRAARQLGAPEQEIDDLIQEVLLVAFQRIPRFEHRSRLSTWLYSILHNVLRNRRRGWGRYDRKLLVYSGVVDEHQPCLCDQILASQVLHDFLATLDEPKRDVFVLADLMGCTGREMGERLGINPNVATARLRAARKAFADWLGDDDAEN